MTRTVTGPGIAPCAAAAAGSGSSYYSPAIVLKTWKIISSSHPANPRNLSSVSRELKGASFLQSQLTLIYIMLPSESKTQMP